MPDDEEVRVITDSILYNENKIFFYFFRCKLGPCIQL